MKKRKISVLITGAGGAGSLGRELMKALNFAKNDYEIVVTNSSPLSVGLFENVKSYLIPSASSKNYINTILDICKKEQIDVVIGGSELEIGVLAKNYKIFSKNKILLLTNSLKIIKLCLDKLKLAEFLSNNKILCP